MTRLGVLILAAFLAGIIVGRATSRPEAQSIPAAAIPSGASRSASWTSGLRTEAPLASATPSGHSTGGASPSPGLIAEGLASWYLWPGHDGLYAALPGPWKPGRRVLLCGPDGECFGGIPVVTRCGCLVGTARARIVDVSPALFAKLGPLSAGLLRVTMTVFG